jgi:hypothetical protein
MMIYELSARYDSRASFYGKAHIKETPKYYTLISYDTEILRQEKSTGAIDFLCRDEWAFSCTTCRHINEFLRQFTNESAKSKRDLLKMARS